eukprot:3029033-Pyramimonas_sp.AAC.1
MAAGFPRDPSCSAWGDSLTDHPEETFGMVLRVSRTIPNRWTTYPRIGAYTSIEASRGGCLQLGRHQQRRAAKESSSSEEEENDEEEEKEEEDEEEKEEKEAEASEGCAEQVGNTPVGVDISSQGDNDGKEEEDRTQVGAPPFSLFDGLFT